MKVSSTDRTIQEVLNLGFFNVPRFQRPYSWDRENVYDFWNDIVNSTDADYFIGSMVVYKNKDGTYGIVDGQQRLTTLTMMLAALRNAYSTEGFEPLAHGIQNLIEKTDVDNTRRYILKTQTSFPYFQEHIQKFGSADLDAKTLREEENLKAAFASLTEFVGDIRGTVRMDPQISEEKKGQEIVKRLTAVRDRLLNLKLIFIDVDEENDAYNIFETLNTRGKDLAVSDLVKNHFTRLIKVTNKGVDVASAKWDEIRTVIEGSQADLRTDTFLHHYWLSKHDFLTIKNLFKNFRKKVTQSTAKQYLSELLDDAKTYRQIHETSYRKWLPQEAPMRDALDSLLLFGVTQPTPMVLAVMRAFNDKELKPKHAKRVLQAIENFHFMFTALTSQRSSGGISAMYSSAARKVSAAQTEEDRLAEIQGLIDKLIQRLPREDEVVFGFEQILFSDSFTKQRRLVRYILSRFYQHLNPSQQFSDFSQMTIEHLLPQSATDTLDEKDAKYIAQLGNLMFVSSTLNSALLDKPFIHKRSILERHKVVLDQYIKKAETWGPTEIAERTKWMAGLAYKKLWKIE